MPSGVSAVMRTRASSFAAIVGVLMSFGVLAINTPAAAAQSTPAAQPAELCVPILDYCEPSEFAPVPGNPVRPPALPALPIPTLTSPVPLPSSALPPLGVITLPGIASPHGDTLIPADAGASTFTLPAAQLTGSSLRIIGPHSLTLVTVPLADGSRAPALKLEAEHVVITDFILDVVKPKGSVLVTTASTMELRGHVVVYLDSITGTLSNGSALTLGATTPPPGDELAPALLRVTIGLIGLTSDVNVLMDSHEAVQ